METKSILKNNSFQEQSAKSSSAECRDKLVKAGLDCNTADKLGDNIR